MSEKVATLLKAVLQVFIFGDVGRVFLFNFLIISEWKIKTVTWSFLWEKFLAINLQLVLKSIFSASLKMEFVVKFWYSHNETKYDYICGSTIFFSFGWNVIFFHDYYKDTKYSCSVRYFYYLLLFTS